jgi:hypothetical protein
VRCAGDARISVQAAAIEFARSGDGTALSVTGQAACLDGIDGPRAPSPREEGVTEMPGGLSGCMAAQGSRPEGITALPTMYSKVFTVINHGML